MGTYAEEREYPILCHFQMAPKGLNQSIPDYFYSLGMVPCNTIHHYKYRRGRRVANAIKINEDSFYFWFYLPSGVCFFLGTRIFESIKNWKSIDFTLTYWEKLEGNTFEMFYFAMHLMKRRMPKFQIVLEMTRGSQKSWTNFYDLKSPSDSVNKIVHFIWKGH